MHLQSQVLDISISLCATLQETEAKAPLSDGDLARSKEYRDLLECGMHLQAQGGPDAVGHAMRLLIQAGVVSKERIQHFWAGLYREESLHDGPAIMDGRRLH